jgi:hypothetical protein
VREVEEVRDPQMVKVEEAVAVEDVVVIILIEKNRIFYFLHDRNIATYYNILH